MAIIKSSTNGSTWTTATVTGTGSTTWATSTVHSLAYANGIWVAGNNANQVAISTSTNTFNIAQGPDPANTGTTWTTVTSNFGTTNIKSIAYGNGLWVAGAYNGQMRTSTNGSTWTTVNSNFGTTNIYSVAYGNGLWVAGGEYGKIRTSTNGSTWVTVTSNFNGDYAGTIQSIAYGNGLWVAGGWYGNMRTSTNGSTWTTVTSNLINAFAGTIFSIAYGNGLWVAGGMYGNMRTSTNGSTWTTVNSNFGNSILDRILSIAYGNGLWVAGGTYGKMRTSPQLYSTVSLPNTQISSFNTSFMAVSSNRPRSSTDGITWTTLSGFESIHINRFVEQNGKHMLLGNSGVLYEKNTSTTTWTTRSTGIADNFINGAIYNNAGTLSYILRGNNAMYYSTNLASWTTISSLAASAVNDIIGKP